MWIKNTSNKIILLKLKNMSEFIVKIKDEIVQSIGKQAIEQYLQLFVTKTILKAAASDILNDYDKDSLNSDNNWITAKNNAFINDIYTKYIKVYANV
jgi:hypothetical protein